MTPTFRFLTLALLTSSLLGLTACRKTNEPAPPPLTERERLLTGPDWQFDRAEERRTTAAGVVTTTPLPAVVFDACSTDDRIHYRTDRTYAIDEGPLACPPPRSLTGTWDFAFLQ